MEENALVSQPWVGMMDGVAASRAECTARLSAASLNDEASRLARRIRALRSTRTSLERRIALPASPSTAGDRRAADAGGLHLGIDRLEVGEDPDAGVALGDAGEGVGEGGEAAVQLVRAAAPAAHSPASAGRTCERSTVRDTVT